MSQPHQVTVDIDDEEPAEATPRTSTFSRLESQSRETRLLPPVPPNRSNLGLGDRLNSVFREIRPLVENARMVSAIYLLKEVLGDAICYLLYL